MNLTLTIKRLRGSIRHGGIWVLLVSKPSMTYILNKLKEERGINVEALRCETVEDVVKMELLIQAFNSWTIEEVKELTKQHNKLKRTLAKEL